MARCSLGLGTNMGRKVACPLTQSVLLELQRCRVTRTFGVPRQRDKKFTEEMDVHPNRGQSSRWNHVNVGCSWKITWSVWDKRKSEVSAPSCRRPTVYLEKRRTLGWIKKIDMLQPCRQALKTRFHSMQLYGCAASGGVGFQLWTGGQEKSAIFSGGWLLVQVPIWGWFGRTRVRYCTRQRKWLREGWRYRSMLLLRCWGVGGILELERPLCHGESCPERNWTQTRTRKSYLSLMTLLRALPVIAHDLFLENSRIMTSNPRKLLICKKFNVRSCDN